MGSAGGFTILELMVVMAIMGIMAALAAPNLSAIRDQMEVADASHRVALTLGEVRAEAIRVKAQSRVTFTSTGFTWDLFNDGSVDGRVSFPRGVVWSGSTPSTIDFDGLGLARGVTDTRQLTVRSGKRNHTVQINKNGYITL